MMDHGKEITTLIKKVETLEKQVATLTKTQETFIPLNQACQALNMTATVLRTRCKNGTFEYGTHFIKNGRNYLISIPKVEEFLKKNNL